MPLWDCPNQTEEKAMAELDLMEQSAAMAREMADYTPDYFDIRAMIKADLDIDDNDAAALAIISQAVSNVLASQFLEELPY